MKLNREIERRIKEFTKRADDILFGTKDQDYNHSGVDIADYYKHWPVQCAMHDIRRKFLRLMSLLGSDDNYKPKHESVDDSFMDLLNYVRIGYAIIKYYDTLEE